MGGGLHRCIYLPPVQPRVVAMGAASVVSEQLVKEPVGVFDSS